MFIPYKLADGTTVMVEVTEETAAFILENDREMANAERRERYHCPYHLEAMTYEGDSVAYHETPEEIVIREESRKEFASALTMLTDAQFRKLLIKADGLTLREIAEREYKTVNAVVKSLSAAKKKLEKYRNFFLKTGCTKRHFFLRIARSASSERRKSTMKHTEMKGGRRWKRTPI